MEKLIVIAVIVAASLVHSWLTRRQEEAEEDTSPNENIPRRPPVRPPPRPAPAGGWEEQMRRLLQGDRPSPPVPPPLPARPAVPPPVLARSSIPVPEEGQEMEVGLPVRPASLQHAVTAHERAQVHANVVQRMQATATRVTAHAGPEMVRPGTTLSAQARGLVRDRESARAAILASVILGPPRGLEPVR